MTEREKMIRGLLYDAFDPELVADRKRAHRLAKELDHLEEDEALRIERFRNLLGETGRNFWIESPFRCDYGYNIRIGEDFYANFGCVILDICPVTIGDRVLLGPGVQIYAVSHPLDAVGRATGAEYGKPIAIGDDVWIGGSSILLPGVSIGNRTVIGAGSVVTRNIPDDVVAAGNPCRVLRPIDGADRHMFEQMRLQSQQKD